MNIGKQHSVIEVDHLSIGYKSTIVAKAINLNACAGELVAIVGANGIGKSTLLRTLGKQQPRLSGTATIQGTSLDDFNASTLAKEISLVLTETPASKNMTVWELIALGRQPYTNWIGSLTEPDLTKIEEAIEMLELGTLQQRPCFELSDGQLQRVMIARALAQDTPILLLDEPTTHLDLHHKVQILKLLKRIAKEKDKTILFTSHEIEMALRICDKMLLLNGTTNPFGSPEFLITTKAFESLFPDDLLTFDSETKSFRIKK